MAEKKRKIIAFLNGGLGNQMFEYALALGVAERLNGNLALDTSAYWLYRFRKLNIFEFVGPCKRTSRIVNMTYSFILWTVRVVVRRLMGHTAQEKTARVVLSLLNLNRVSAPSAWTYASLFMDDNLGDGKNVLIHGIYQFLPPLASRQMLREEFKIVSPPTTVAQKYLDMIREKSTESVCVHVRRGDYTNLSMVLPVEYYRRATKKMEEVKRGKNLRYFVFSDDPEWCKATFSHLNDVVFVVGDVSNPVEDLRLMTSCRHHIIANSTFSFWGAYLADENEDSVTIAPEKWSPDFTTSDTMVPGKWLLVPSFGEN